MPKKLILSAVLFVLIVMLTSIPLSTITYAQDPTATPIAILPETTEDSAAPLAPGVSSSSGEATEIIETTVEPQPTAVVESESSAPLTAPEPAVCTFSAQTAFTATEILCADTAQGQACVGNGTVDSVFADGATGSFSQANDRVQITSLDQITLTSGANWTVVRLQLPLTSSDGGASVTTTSYAYGNMTLAASEQNTSGGTRVGTVLAESGMNVRRTPGNDGIPIWQLRGGDEVTVTGISADRVWIRIIIPNRYAGTGWVYAPYIDVDGGAETLDVVTVNSPQPVVSVLTFDAGQTFELVTAPPQTDCELPVPVSGLLMQSPSGIPDLLRLQVNSAEIQFNGTVFIQALAGDEMRISVLEGEATAIASGEQVSATVNNRIVIALDASLTATSAPQVQAIGANELSDVPTRILPRQVAFGQEPVDLSGVGSNNVNPPSSESDSSDEETESEGSATPQASSVPSSVNCTLTAEGGVRNVRAGASTVFEVVQVLQPGQSVSGIGQAVGELNLTWYQTEDEGWLRIDTIEVSEDCASLPVVEPPELPEVAAEVDDDETPPGAISLSASNLAPLSCDGRTITGSGTSTGVDTSIAIGGTWSATAGTQVTFTTQGGLMRPEFGDFIRLVAQGGSTLASSGEARSLTFTFTADSVFEARFSAANGDTVVMAASCQPTS